MLSCPDCAAQLQLVSVADELRTIADALDGGHHDEALSRVYRLLSSDAEFETLYVGLALARK